MPRFSRGGRRKRVVTRHVGIQGSAPMTEQEAKALASEFEGNRYWEPVEVANNSSDGGYTTRLRNRVRDYDLVLYQPPDAYNRAAISFWGENPDKAYVSPRDTEDE